MQGIRKRRIWNFIYRSRWKQNCRFYGPKGIGVLYLRDGVKFRKYLNGGHQERNRRAGTENVAGIVGLAKALTIAYENLEENNNRTIELRNYFINEIKNI